MTLIGGSQSVGDQDPRSHPSESGRGRVDDNTVPSAQGLVAARSPMSPEVAVMFSLLMRQMDRLHEQARDSMGRLDEAGQASARIE